MQFSEQYLSLLRAFEGFHDKPYVCPAGKCTIGYGTNLEKHRNFIPYDDIRAGQLKGRALCKALLEHNMVWSDDDAKQAMVEELSATEATLDKKCPAYRKLRSLKDTVRAECLLDMAYNMGVAGLLGFYSTLPMIERGDYAAASESLTHSKWYRETGRRSRAICGMLASGEYVAPADLA